MLKQYYFNTNMINDVYKWGMHVSSIYLFDAIVCVAGPEVYSRAWLLMAFTAPFGSAIAIWQLWAMQAYEEDLVLQSGEARTVQFLFCLRALSGIVQLVALLWLKNVDVDTSVPSTEEASTTECASASTSVAETARAIGEEELSSQFEQELSSLMSKARTALMKMYVPAMYIHGFVAAVASNCSEPMISPTTPSSSESCEDGQGGAFVLGQNWPGIGLYFHFGLLLVIFADDGIRTPTPQYKPSLAIASLFAFHISLLLAISLLLRLTHRYWVDDMEGDVGGATVLEFVATLTMLAWMATSGYLSACLHRLWHTRVQPV